MKLGELDNICIQTNDGIYCFTIQRIERGKAYMLLNPTLMKTEYNRYTYFIGFDEEIEVDIDKLLEGIVYYKKWLEK